MYIAGKMSMGEIALNWSFEKVNVNEVNILLCACKTFLDILFYACLLTYLSMVSGFSPEVTMGGRL